MSDNEHNESLGKVVTEHAIGTVILGSAMAGIGALAGLRSGGSVKSEAFLAGAMGLVGGLGFGRTVYKGAFGWAAAREKPQLDSWTDRISQSSQDTSIRR
ncbi:hypothetical protein [uncultured Brevundimonas sp.]|jgi:hypothetical protein|uniref:hypothetical protein n=1 Tax=uncultured Brevundimonas sp. TaxID=213418 RepID=UPI0026332234|nr:hypothetical protein [uncultured Brevundimonas sp.]